ncbi:MAG: S-layer homology domain-containing protein [Bacillota bacterium]
MRRKILAGLVAGSLVLGTAAPVLAKGPDKDPRHGKEPVQVRLAFKDWQDGYWANEALARMVLRGVILGDPSGYIAPQRLVTKLEAAVMLVRALGLEPAVKDGKWSGHLEGGKWEFKVGGKKIEYKVQYRGEHFEFKWDKHGLKVESKGPGQKLVWEIRDGNLVPDWGRGYVQVALAQGFLVPTDGFLNILSPLNRLDAAVMLVRAAGLDAEARARAGASLPFTDAGQIPPELRGYVALAVENGLVSGYPEGDFRPYQPVTRAEWAALLDRFDRRAEEPADVRQVRGTVAEVKTGAQPRITLITRSNPDGVTYPVAPDVLVFIAGKEASLRDLKVGDQVIAQLDEEGRVIFLVGTGKVEPERSQVQGEVAGLGKTRILLEVDGLFRSYRLASDLRVYENGKAIDYEDLQPGDEVRLTLQGDTVVRIDRLEADRTLVERTGRVQRVDLDESAFWLYGDDGQRPQQVEVRVDEVDGVVFKDLKLDLEVLARGQRVLVAGTWDGDVLEAESLALDPEESEVVFTAELLSRALKDGRPDSVIVRVGGRRAELPVSPRVAVTEDGKAIRYADLEAGATVTVTWRSGGVVALAVEADE